MYRRSDKIMSLMSKLKGQTEGNKNEYNMYSLIIHEIKTKCVHCPYYSSKKNNEDWLLQHEISKIMPMFIQVLYLFQTSI